MGSWQCVTLVWELLDEEACKQARCAAAGAVSMLLLWLLEEEMRCYVHWLLQLGEWRAAWQAGLCRSAQVSGCAGNQAWAHTGRQGCTLVGMKTTGEGLCGAVLDSGM